MSYNRAVSPQVCCCVSSSNSRRTKKINIYITTHLTITFNGWPQDSAGRRRPPWDCRLCPCFGDRSGPGPVSGGCCPGPGGPNTGRRVATNGRSSSGGPPGSVAAAAAAGACAATATDHIPLLCNWRVGRCGSRGPAAGLLGLTLKKRSRFNFYKPTTIRTQRVDTSNSTLPFLRIAFLICGMDVETRTM